MHESGTCVSFGQEHVGFVEEQDTVPLVGQGEVFLEVLFDLLVLISNVTWDLVRILLLMRAPERNLPQVMENKGRFV